MEKFCVIGFVILSGLVNILGVKNVVLFIFFVVILVIELVILINVFVLKDVDMIFKILCKLGVVVECVENGDVYIDVSKIDYYIVFYELVKIM